MAKGKRSDEALLKRIRDRYDYAMSAWGDIRAEARIDMRYVAGDPWTEAEKRAREAAGRPCFSLDELNQYLNQAINNLRMGRRGIKVSPAGNQATSETAELHEDAIRGIEYRSNAWRGAYVPAFENALQRGYGFFRVTRDYAASSGLEQHIVIEGILNPDTVLYDPDCRKADWSDAEWCFLVDRMSEEEFKRRYPGREIRSFSDEHRAEAMAWIGEKQVMVAEYWEVERVLDRQEEGDDEEEVGTDNTRQAEEATVRHYVTNGVEILEETEIPGAEIPVIPVIGKELYVDEGGGAKRRILSMVRLARDAQKLYAYLCSQEAEEAKMAPKAPFVGYKGQFDSDQEAWETVSEVPRAYLQIDAIIDQASGGVLPKPDRPQFTPNFAAYQVAKEGARRAIQAAMGIMPLPTAAQRQNEKSGVALSRIQSQEQIGSFHFTDNFDRALVRAGRIIESWLAVVYDTEREIGIRRADESHTLIRINTEAPYEHEGRMRHYRMDVGEHEVTISTGPSFDSEREEAADFVDTLVEHAPQLMPLIGDLLVKMRNLGTLGDEIAERLTPPQFARPGSPQAMAAQQAQAGQQLQAAQALIQQLQAEVARMTQEKQAKVVEQQGRVQLEQARQVAGVELEKLKMQVQVTVAEIEARAQNERERMQWEHEVWKQTHQSAHEVAMRASAPAPAMPAPA